MRPRHARRSRKSPKAAEPHRAGSGRPRRVCGRHERLELFAIAISRRAALRRAGGRMKVDLAQARPADARIRPDRRCRGHLSGPMQPEHAIGCEQAGGASAAAAKRRTARASARQPTAFAARSVAAPGRAPAARAPRAGRSDRRSRHQTRRPPGADGNACARCNDRASRPVARKASNCAPISAASCGAPVG